MIKKQAHRKKRGSKQTSDEVTRVSHTWPTSGEHAAHVTCVACARGYLQPSSNESKNLQFRLNDPIATQLTNNWKTNVFWSGSRGVLNFRLFLTILSHLIIRKQLKDLHNWLTKFSFYTSIDNIEKFYFKTYFDLILHVFLP